MRSMVVGGRFADRANDRDAIPLATKRSEARPPAELKAPQNLLKTLE
jgi:hypothetical protein